MDDEDDSHEQLLTDQSHARAPVGRNDGGLKAASRNQGDNRSVQWRDDGQYYPFGQGACPHLLCTDHLKDLKSLHFALAFCTCVTGMKNLERMFRLKATKAWR